MRYPEFPEPLGVFRAVESELYDVNVRQQNVDAIAKYGEGDLQELLWGMRHGRWGRQIQSMYREPSTESSDSWIAPTVILRYAEGCSPVYPVGVDPSEYLPGYCYDFR